MHIAWRIRSRIRVCSHDAPEKQIHGSVDALHPSEGCTTYVGGRACNTVGEQPECFQINRDEFGQCGAQHTATNVRMRCET